jgi:hypothetical protein
MYVCMYLDFGSVGGFTPCTYRVIGKKANHGRPAIEAKEAYHRSKRDLLWGISESREPPSRVDLWNRRWALSSDTNGQRVIAPTGV